MQLKGNSCNKQTNEVDLLVWIIGALKLKGCWKWAVRGLVRLNSDNNKGSAYDCLLLLILSILPMSHLSFAIGSIRNTPTRKYISFMIDLENTASWEVSNIAGASLFRIFHPTHSSKLDRVPRSPYFVKLGNQYLLEEDGQIASFFLGGFRRSLDPKSRARQPHFFQTQAFLWPPVLHSSIFCIFTHFSTLHWTYFLKLFYHNLI